MQLAIVGSRNYTDYASFKTHVLEYIAAHEYPSTIISGGCRGTDTLARRFAHEKNIPLIEHIPQWSNGRVAGPERNRLIVQDATHVLAFLGKGSRGTRDTMRKARYWKKHLTVINVDCT